MNRMDENMLLLTAVNSSIAAGREIMAVYQQDFSFETKADNSPLTEADKRSHRRIEKDLIPLGLPILSEEGRSIEYPKRKNWRRYWLVDPLDGTKEFIKKNGEFTVNIALMEDQFPIAGIIYVPAKNTLYWCMGQVSYKVTNVHSQYEDMNQLINASEMLPLSFRDRPYTVVGSKSHPSPETQEYIETIEAEKGNVEVISMGSSLKLCLVAEGAADSYPRFAPTMEWDTAAGQAIAEGAGATVINWETKSRMAYNKENLLNNWFLVERV